MPVAELLSGEKRGHVWLLDVSFDDFQTVSYRWSTASCRIDGNEYDGRIASLTPIERGFGRDHLPAATTTRLRIENSDFGVDWLIDRAMVGSQLLRARFRLSVYLYDSRAYATAADELSGAQQFIGIFTCLDEPEAMAEAVDLSLSDDSLGRLAEPLTTPSVLDWKNASVVAPMHVLGAMQLMDWSVPLPLVFGSATLAPAYSAIANYRSMPSPPYNAHQLLNLQLTPQVTFPIVICAAKADTQPVGVPEVAELFATYSEAIQDECKELRGVTVKIPAKFAYRTPINNPGTIGTVDVVIWRPRRSASFTKDGRSWQVVYVDFDCDAYVLWYHDQFDSTAQNGIQATPNGANAGTIAPVPLGGVDSPAMAADGAIAKGSRSHIMAAFSHFQVRSGPLGHFSTVTTRTPVTSPFSKPSQLLVDFIHDAIAYYSKASLADIDAASFARAVKARATVQGAGIIQPARPKPVKSIQRNGWVSPNPRDGIIGVLRTALGEMCGSADVDLFMKKDGTYALSTIVFDYEAVTGTRTSIDEARTARIRTRTPSDGERWAPYNRVFLSGPGGVPYGPYDNQEAIDAWGIIKPVTLQAKWNARLWGENSNAGASTVWMYRTLESKVRPAIRFLADREYLQLELGDYFDFTWTRGGQSALYSGTIFRLESQRIDPNTLAVDLGAIWADDLASVNPYLLDNETLLVRVASSAGRTVSVTDGNTTATFNIGGLGTDGVKAGDILELKDASQADNVFTRYRRLRIASVDSDKEVTVVAPDDDPDLDFDAPGGATVTTWTIYRGATTYHDSVSDPSNYPDDGDMYGKASNTSDVYSDASAANQLLDG